MGGQIMVSSRETRLCKVEKAPAASDSANLHVFTAPEVQSSSVCSILSDMFSLGMVMCAIFNHGKPLIQANHSSSTYVKQLDLVRAFSKHFCFKCLSGYIKIASAISRYLKIIFSARY